jgi:DnaJ-class molecular chaperone
MAGPEPRPDDEVAPGTPQSGEAPCRACMGSGRVEGNPCPHCGGTGKVTVLVGDA